MFSFFIIETQLLKSCIFIFMNRNITFNEVLKTKCSQKHKTDEISTNFNILYHLETKFKIALNLVKVFYSLRTCVHINSKLSNLIKDYYKIMNKSSLCIFDRNCKIDCKINYKIDCKIDCKN